VLIALALGGMLLLGARALLENVADQEHRIAETAAAVDAEMNGERLLRALAGGLEVGTDESAPFEGTPTNVQFSTWCDRPQGWQARCDVMLLVDTIDVSRPDVSRLSDAAYGATLRTAHGSRVLVARFADGLTVPLLYGVRADAFRYLVSASSGGTWFRNWGRGITAPLAIGILRGCDTLIVRIGERG
jgi:hypothetical protein